jgi:predicted transcriptional regulator
MTWESPEQRSLWQDFYRLAFDRQKIQGLVNHLKGRKVNANNALVVFYAIIERTLPFGKLYECIRMHELATKCGISERTVYRCLDALIGANFILKMKNDKGNECYFAPNLEGLMPLIKEAIDGESQKVGNVKAAQTLWEKIMASPVFRGMCHALEALSGFVVSGVEQVKEKFAEVKCTMAGMLENLKAAKAKAVETSEAKRDKKAAEPLFDHKGKVNGRAGLSLWHSKVRDEDRYAGYKGLMTGLYVGQMRHFLKELAGEDMSEDRIREIIHEAVTNWKSITQTQRSLQCVSSKGKTYTTTIPVDPDFSFYYAHRKEMNRILHVRAVQQPIYVPSAERDSSHDF